MNKIGLWYYQDRTWIGLHQDFDWTILDDNIPEDNIPEDNIPEDNVPEENIQEEITLDIPSMALSAQLVCKYGRKEQSN